MVANGTALDATLPYKAVQALTCSITPKSLAAPIVQAIQFTWVNGNDENSLKNVVATEGLKD
jgi:hypothetical protein